VGLSTEVRDGILIVAPDYESGGMAIREQIGMAMAKAKEMKAKAVVLNLHHLDFIDTISLGAIVSGRDLLRDVCEVYLCGISGEAKRAINSHRMDLIFKIHDDIDAALEDVKSP